MTVKAKLRFGAAGGALAVVWMMFLGLGTHGARAADPAPAAAPPPPAVTVAKPVFKRITEWDDYTGRFIAKERVDVRARVSGYLESVHFKEGQMVEAGELLFVIDQRTFKTEVARAKAGVDQAGTQPQGRAARVRTRSAPAIVARHEHRDRRGATRQA
ncbi:MAG: biotin/lipoyl-binding protein [Proteobacteria bacterium]|nr:biotin/lipoyl-binding protein [Pseudomonadota bacterium]